MSESKRACLKPTPSSNRDRVMSGSAPRSIIGSFVAQEVPALGSGGAFLSGWVRSVIAASFSSTKLPSPSMVQPDNWGQMARTACRLPSMPARVPAHSWVLPHVVVACLPVWVMLHDDINLIILLPAARGLNLDISSRNFSDGKPFRRTHPQSMSPSTPVGPAQPPSVFAHFPTFSSEE